MLRGQLALPRLRLIDRVTFVVDTGANSTCLHPYDARRLGVDYNALAPGTPGRGVGGTQEQFSEEAVLSFFDGTNVYFYFLEVDIPAVTDASLNLPSLLGQDVLRHWRMVHDPARGALRFTVRGADSTVAV